MKIQAIFQYISADLGRYSVQNTPATFIKSYDRNKSFRYCFWFRLCKSDNRGICLIAAILHERMSKSFGIQIPRKTKIGKGLYIGHYMSVVIHPFTIIGCNCNISQFTTIGSNNNTPANIGDNVYIGPGCSIVENVTIGDNAIIGAGSVVVKNIPGNCTAAGNPARVVSAKYRAEDTSIIDPTAGSVRAG